MDTSSGRAGRTKERKTKQKEREKGGKVYIDVVLSVVFKHFFLFVDENKVGSNLSTVAHH